jgi:hypothetical protein
VLPEAMDAGRAAYGVGYESLRLGVPNSWCLFEAGEGWSLLSVPLSVESDIIRHPEA